MIKSTLWYKHRHEKDIVEVNIIDFICILQGKREKYAKL